MSKDLINSNLRSRNFSSQLDRSLTGSSTLSCLNDSVIKKTGFSSLYTPKETMDTHFANRFFQVTRMNDFNGISRYKNNKKQLRLSETSLASFFEDERCASEFGKGDIHRKIIEIGNSTHESILEEMRKEYENKFKIKELLLSEHYKRLKEFEIEKERVKFASKIDNIKSQYKAEYDRQYREKVSENEIYNQNIAKEQIEINRIEAKKVLKETVQKLKSAAEKEKRLAVEAAIIKEKEIAKSQFEEKSRLHENKIQELKEVHLNELNQKLEELRLLLSKEYEQLIVKHVEKVIAEKSVETETIKNACEVKLVEAEEKYLAKLNEINELNKHISALIFEISTLKEVANGVKNEYQDCIAHFIHLKKKEADFLFPLYESTSKSRKK